MSLPEKVKIVEVGPRDGLQNETDLVDVKTRIELVERLVDAGLRNIEVGSFVNPKWVPQMASSDEVFRALKRVPGVSYSALTPNLQGFESAASVQACEVAVFAAASESFSQKNINCSITQSLERFRPVMAAAKARAIPVRGYVSCVVGCPYEGAIEPDRVAWVCEQLITMGCYEISLGDTVGVGTPASVLAMLESVTASVPRENLAVHFHDTYGQALTNIYAALEQGVAVVDSSVSGLGGCPYAKGAAGNVASEDLVYLLNGLGIEHGVELEKLIEAGRFIMGKLGRPSGSKVSRAC